MLFDVQSDERPRKTAKGWEECTQCGVSLSSRQPMSGTGGAATGGGVATVAPQRLREEGGRQMCRCGWH